MTRNGFHSLNCPAAYLRWKFLIPLLLAAPSVLSAQPSLTITAPASGIVVHPGDTVKVVVTATGSFQEVGLIGTGRLAMLLSQDKRSPFEFEVHLRNDLGARTYYLTAVAAERPGEAVYSPPISLIVEPVDPLLRLHVEPPVIELSSTGRGYLYIEGIYPRETTVNLTKSPTLRYVSEDESIAQVTADGTIRAVSPGSTRVTVDYRGVKHVVPVVVGGAKK